MVPGVFANKKGTLLECAVQYNVTGTLDGTEALIIPEVLLGT